MKNIIINIIKILSLTLIIQACKAESLANLKQLPLIADGLYPITTDKGTFWLSTSEKRHLQLLDSNFEELEQADIRAENLVLSSEADKTAVLLQDKRDNSIHTILIDHEQPSLSNKFRESVPKTGFEAACIYLRENTLDRFDLDFNGIAHHYRYPNVRQMKRFSIRQMAVGPNPKSCIINPTLDAIYVAEENVGVWRYALDEESEPNRELVYLSDNASIEHLSLITPQLLAMSGPDDNTLTLFDPVTESVRATLSFPVSQLSSPDFVYAYAENDQINVLARQDEENTILASTLKIEPLELQHNEPADSEVTTVFAFGQTEPVPDFGDAADDPAIWINTSAPEHSRIIGTNKQRGIETYDLNGKKLQTLDIGKVNNVDVRSLSSVSETFPYTAIVTASNRSTQSISVMGIHSKTLTLDVFKDIPTQLDDVYGLCMFNYHNQMGVVINDTSGQFEIHRFTSFEPLQTERIKVFSTQSQPEGCVVNDSTGQLFYGEEEVGIWLRQLDNVEKPLSIFKLTPPVEADIEGMGLYHVGETSYLLVSSQGNNQFAIFDAAPPYTLLGTFAIRANSALAIDGVSETDGLAVTSSQLGNKYEKGLLVVQDGHNVMPQRQQNFKLVDGKFVADLIAQWERENRQH